MAPRGYPAEFRRRVIDLVEAGRPVAAVAADLGIGGQSIYRWRRQARIDASDPVRPDTAAVISASVGAETGPVVTLYFSDSVSPADNVDRLRDIVEANGVPAVVLDAVTSSTGGACDNTRIDMTLGQHLRAGDVVSVVASSATFGTGADQRTVAPASAALRVLRATAGRWCSTRPAPTASRSRWTSTCASTPVVSG